jgi:hypothetical protein
MFRLLTSESHCVKNRWCLIDINCLCKKYFEHQVQYEYSSLLKAVAMYPVCFVDDPPQTTDLLEQLRARLSSSELV